MDPKTPPAPPPRKTPVKLSNGPFIGLILAAGLALVVLLVIRYMQDNEPEDVVQATDIQTGLDECMADRVREGLVHLDSLNALAPGHADVLATRGLCRSIRFAADSVQADARAGFADLSAAIAAIQSAPDAFQTPLDRLYHQRAFLVQAIRPGDWSASLADFDRAIDLNPEAPGIVLDRGMARAFAGDTAAARADLRRYEQLEPNDNVKTRPLRELLQPPAPRRDTSASVAA